jgi:hypothetical protein
MKKRTTTKTNINTNVKIPDKETTRANEKKETEKQQISRTLKRELASLYLARCDSYLRSNNFSNALNDAETAISFFPTTSCFIKKGGLFCFVYFVCFDFVFNFFIHFQCFDRCFERFRQT